MDPLLIVIIVLLVAILAAVVWIAIELRTFCSRFKAPGHWIHTHVPPIHVNPMPPGGSGPVTLWIWAQGKWVVEGASLPEGADPGPPPPRPGTFEGERVRMPAPRPGS